MQKKKEEKGITLIALVITIIVTLILSGVTIATLTGDNGLLTIAENAKIKSEEANITEQIEIAIINSYNKKGNLELENLIDNLNSVKELKEIHENKFPLLVEAKNGNKYVVKKDGDLVDTIKAGERAPDNKNVAYIDEKYIAIIPAGFTVSEKDDEKSIESGLVIKDDKNNEFVWIPVGINMKTETQIEGKNTIELKRYNFDSNGIASVYSGNFIEEDSNNRTYSTYKNTVAKDINEFIKKTNENGGYYIGRYEARKNSIGQLSELKSDDVYNWVKQNEAAEKCRTMYATNNCFVSDLINSYAWDTATLFLQEYDNRTNGSKPYSQQNSLVYSACNKGTNNQQDSSKIDKICNVYDMASNCVEWTTETYGESGSACFVQRGGTWYTRDKFYTSNRLNQNANTGTATDSFRPIIYIK